MKTKRDEKSIKLSIERMSHALFMLETVNRLPGGDFQVAVAAAELIHKFKGHPMGSRSELICVHRALQLMEAICKTQNEQDDMVTWNHEKRIIEIIMENARLEMGLGAIKDVLFCPSEIEVP